MTGRHRTKKNGKLVIQRHGDCFVHAPPNWLHYWPISLPRENLMLVKVTLESGHHFLTSIFPNPLPVKPTTASFRPPSKELEIDPSFAAQIGIAVPKTEVLVECVSDIERCTTLCLEPLNSEDFEKLELNREQVERELLNRIRVVSAYSFSFPIWIDQEVIPVRVVSSEPAATWVLLGSESTGLRGEAATTLTFKRRSDFSPSSTASSSSSYSTPLSPLSVGCDSLYYHSSSNSLVTGGEEHSVDASPDVDIENVSVTSSTSSKLLDFFRPIFSAINTQGSIQANLDTDRPSSKTPEPTAGKSAPPTINKPNPMHRKTKSCSQILESDSPVHPRFPKYVETPEINTLLRVQPHTIGGPGRIWRRGSRNLAPQWELTRAFDVYVHPSTLPEISNYYHSSHHLGSFLVLLKSTKSSNSRPKSTNSTHESQARNEATTSAPPFPTLPPPPLPGEISPSLSETSENLISPVSEAGFELSRIMSVVATLHESQTGSEVENPQSVAKSDKPPLSLVLPEHLVVRLCLATTLVVSTNGRVIPFPHPPPASLPKIYGECEKLLEVAPGHVVMSDLVRSQLRIGACSLVRVSNVKDEGRLPIGSKPVSIQLRPLNEQLALLKQQRENVEERVKVWTQKVGRENQFGAILVQNQIIPYVDSNRGIEYCNVEVVTRSQQPNEKSSLVNYVMFPAHEVGSTSHKLGRVRFSVEKTRWNPGPVAILPSLCGLDPPCIDVNPRHFGAFEDMIDRGRHYLQSALLRRGSHQPSGRLLICGSTGDSGLACGKTSLVKLILQTLSSRPFHAHIQIINCTSFRAQTAVRVGKRLKDIFDLAINCQPSVVVLDDLHHVMENCSDVGEDHTSPDALLATRNTQALLDQLSRLDRSPATVAVVATTRCIQDLHPMLVQSRGSHLFEEKIEILPPDLTGRESILSAVMESRCVYLHGDLRQIAVRTEGYQVGDLVSLVDRAISSSHIRQVCPGSNRGSISMRKWTSSRVSFTLEDLDFSREGGDREGTPLISHSLPASPLKERKRIRNNKSFSFTEVSTTSMTATTSAENINVSTVTLSERTDSRTRTNEEEEEEKEEEEEGRIRLSERDFEEALDGFAPLALQSLSLHSAGTIDFSHIGGMEETKKTLRETILWPSKYPKLYGQCPIRMCRGILLYGPPGTGKTLLAGSIAKEFSLNFVSVKGPEILSKYIGASEKAVRDLFIRAQAAKPCVLFFDEFDSLASRRGKDRTGVTDRVVNQLLTQMDGVESLEGVYIVAATSRPDMIDPALLRPGRMDKSILCNYPDEAERLEILKTVTRRMPLESKACLKQIAQSTTNYTGADLKAVLYSAQLRAAHRALEEERRESRRKEISPPGAGLGKDGGGGGGGERSGVASVRVYRLSSGNCTELAPDPVLQEQAMELNQLSREVQLDTLTSNISQAIQKDVKKKARVNITEEDLKAALEDVKPSVSSEERQRLKNIYDRYTGKIPQTLKSVTNQRTTMA